MSSPNPLRLYARHGVVDTALVRRDSLSNRHPHCAKEPATRCRAMLAAHGKAAPAGIRADPAAL